MTQKSSRVIEISPEVDEPDSFVPKSFLPSARNSFRKKIDLEVFDFNQQRPAQRSVRAKKTINFQSTKEELDPFSERFQDQFDTDGKGIAYRKRQTKLMRGDGEGQYDNEEDYGSQEEGPGEDEEEEGMDYMTQQPEEVFDIVMNPDKIELENYLKLDEIFGWRYVDPEIKVQRSLSLDHAVPYEMGEDEYIARKESFK